MAGRKKKASSKKRSGGGRKVSIVKGRRKAPVKAGRTRGRKSYK